MVRTRQDPWLHPGWKIKKWATVQTPNEHERLSYNRKLIKDVPQVDRGGAQKLPYILLAEQKIHSDKSIIASPQNHL